MTEIDAITPDSEQAVLKPAESVSSGMAIPAETSLRAKAIRGSVWTILGYGTGQVLRLGSNLILTRLLFPEAFGLMALVNVFMQGLAMFSDVGIGPSIIQNKRGDDPVFLNTAWTIQVVRGVALWIVSCLIAWPVAKLYGQPMLFQLLPVAGLTALIAGFNSTSLFTCNRNLALGRLTILDFVTQVISISVMCFWAWLFPSVWALVGGGLTGAFIKMILSHTTLPGVPARLHYETWAVKLIVHFGRWLFVTSLLTFLAMQLDRLLVGYLLKVDRLGLYTIALTLALPFQMLVSQLGTNILFPAFSSLVRNNNPQLKSRIEKSRRLLVIPPVLVMLILIIWGDRLILLLYDTRYADAGFMFRILAAGSVAKLICSSYGCPLLAIGATFEIAASLASQIIFLIGFGFLGFFLIGEKGFIIGIAAVEWVNYWVLACFVKKYGFWQPQLDIPLFLLTGLVIAITVYIGH